MEANVFSGKQWCELPEKQADTQTKCNIKALRVQYIVFAQAFPQGKCTSQSLEWYRTYKKTCRKAGLFGKVDEEIQLYNYPVKPLSDEVRTFLFLFIENQNEFVTQNIKLFNRCMNTLGFF